MMIKATRRATLVVVVVVLEVDYQKATGNQELHFIESQ